MNRHPRTDLLHLANLSGNVTYAEERVRERTCFFTLPELVAAVPGNSRYPVERAMRYKKRLLPEIFQWPIVTVAAMSGFHPLVRCWLVFRKGAVPELIYRVIAAEVAEKAAKGLGDDWPHAWDIVERLYRCTRKRDRVDNLADLAAAQKLSSTYPVTPEKLALLCALGAAADLDPMPAAVVSAGWLIDGYKALDSPNDAVVSLWVGQLIQETCAKALAKHPQQTLLKSSLGTGIRK